MKLREIGHKIHWLDWLSLGIWLLLLAGYLINLTGWRVFDDEGEYLYQVWRMTAGEMPYRDFLTPQLPVFLFSGAAVMSLVGPSLLIMRLLSVAAAFLSGGLLFLAGRKFNGPLTGLLAMSLFLLHADTFRETRIFRNEPLLLLLETGGLVLAFWPTERRRRSLAVAGLMFGLATMAKLFGLLPAAGVGFWLLWEWWHERRRFREFLGDALALTVPLAATLVLFVAAFSLWTPEFLDLVLGHHLAQGSGQTTGAVLQDKLRLIWAFVSLYPILVGLAIVSSVLGLARDDARVRWFWQLPTVAALLILTRELGQRHFMYLLPALVVLTGWVLADGLQGRLRLVGRLASAVLLVVMVVPWLRLNLDRGSWRDADTQRVVQAIQEESEPGQAILADDIGLAFYARRPTTYLGAALSHGAATSGQITGEQLIEEIVQDNVQIVIVDESLLTGNHMVFLRDYPRFHRFLERNFEYRRQIRRDYQELALWVRREGQPWVTDDELKASYESGARFGDSIRLLGYDLDRESAAPGDTIYLTLYWQADGPADNYWSVFTHLLNPDGTMVAQDDKVPYGGLYPPNRWWAGQIIDDDYALTVPLDAPSGAYHIALGMYDHLTGERLQLWTDSGQPIQDNQLRLDTPVMVGGEQTFGSATLSQ